MNRPVSPWWVYVLQSAGHPPRRYVGCTRDLPRALQRHKVGRMAATRKGGPWEVVATFALPDRERARRLVARLKAGSDPPSKTLP